MPILLAPSSAVENLIGERAYATLMLVHGGRRLRIPRDVSRADQLVQWIGPEHAQALVAEFGGAEIEIRNGKAIAPLDAKVLRLRLKHRMTHAEIADTLGCTERAVRRCLARARTGHGPGLPEQANG